MSEHPREIIIGLEVHVQLATDSKLFCRCSTAYGAEPNTQTCPVCIGMPGSLPIMNRKAYELALRTALALDCTIPAFTKWDRKQYFYPDLPKGYQISQFDLPMSENGFLEISDDDGAFETKKIGILRAHLEDDAGKSLHDETRGKADSRIDLNRTGTPLLEIVSQPDMRSPAEARAYLEELKLLLRYIDVSDCNMQEGSLRVDANVNLHLQVAGEKIATPIVEIKNMNSFRAVERALAYEAERQYTIWLETGKKIGDVPKQTRGWDDAAEVTKGQRAKEESSDYRYFPDPDLVPVTITEARIAETRAQLPELPAALRQRMMGEFQLSQYDARLLVNQGRDVVDYFFAVVAECNDGKQASNWIQRDVLRQMKENEIGIAQYPVPASALGEMIAATENGTLEKSRADEVLQHMRTQQTRVVDAMKALGIEKVDTSELESLCKELLQSNPQVIADVQSGNQKAVGALIGQAKKRNPNANPTQVREICLALIAKL